MREPILGYRCWFGEALPPLDGTDDLREPVLRSLGFTDLDWTARTVTADCHAWFDLGRFLAHGPVWRLRPAPHPRCWCGLHAYDRLDAARIHLDRFLPSLSERIVLGAVLLWGRIVVSEVHDSGSLPKPRLLYRAQNARVLALCSEDRAAWRVADRWGIPAVSERRLEEMAGEYGGP